MRAVRLFLILALLFLLPFLWFGGSFESWFSGMGAVEWLRGLGAWGWLGGMGLLVADLALPVPGTAVISALGFVYGAVIGGMVGALGSFLAGTLAYGLSWKYGRRWADRLAGPGQLARYEALFARSGVWLVALSRWLPLLPEVVACLAGLSRMPARKFFPALACGTAPLGFVFAAVGAAGVERPGLALTLSALLPLGCLAAGWHWWRPGR